MMLSDICLSDVCCVYTSGLSREQLERPRKTKIGAGVAHVTRTPLSKSKVKVTRPLYSPPYWRVRQLQRLAWERVGRGKLLLCRLLGGARRVGARSHGRRGAGAYRGGRPPIHLVKLVIQ